jgi:tagatose 1,6-diphosphate aldolase
MAVAPDSPATATRLGATALTGRGLTPGKLRGLQRISNPNGTLTMVAFDQNASMIDLAAKGLKARGEDREPTFEEVVDAKLDMVRHMAPAGSGILLDAYYGAWPAIASGAMPPDRGLIVRIEKSGAPKNKAGAPLGLIEPGLSVLKLKLMGVDVLKLLVQFEPGELDSASYQFDFMMKVYEDCKKYDMLFLLEPVAVPLNGEKKDSPSFVARKAETVIESARQLSRWCDIYKAEFPGTLDHDSEEQLLDNLQALSESSERPWVLLSAGVDYEDYLRQVKMAVECGATGVLGGRAFWKEYFTYSTPAERSAFASGTAFQRITEVNDLVRDRATPWFAKYGLSADDFAGIRSAEGWHLRYAPWAEAAGGASGQTVKLGDVY